MMGKAADFLQRFEKHMKMYARFFVYLSYELRKVYAMSIFLNKFI